MTDDCTNLSDKNYMRIEQSQLQLSAQSSFSREQVRIRQVSPPPARPEAPVDQVSVQGTASTSDSGDQPLDPKLYLMLKVVEMMLGKEIPLFRVSAKGAAAPVQVQNESAPQAQAQAQVRSMQMQVEAQQVQFQAKGSVETADGRRIDFQADLALSRQFVQITTGEGAASGKKDPLVLNFDGKGVRLLSNRIGFDLNGDGQLESVPLVAKGSGVLFADRNGDGVANDGTELFGPQSGNGFADLAQQDSDGNGWIDQSDPVFGQLRVWFQDAAGPGTTYSLKDLGVGAISTSSVDTPFDLHTAGNALLGQIRSSGVYLREDGQAGIVQQADVAV
jgi:hypothetical protein